MTRDLLKQTCKKPVQTFCVQSGPGMQAFLVWMACFLFSMQVNAQVHTIRIDEVMPHNGRTLSDESGKFPDWVELVNTGNQVVDLRDHGLSIDPERPFLFQFPTYQMAPGERVVVFCSGRDDVPLAPVRPRGESAVKPSMDGVVFHLDASVQGAFELHGNGGIAQWADQSGQGHHARQTEPERAPVFSRLAPQGTPAVFFDGENDFFELDPLNNTKMVFWVGAEHPFATDDFRPILGHSTQSPMIRGSNHQLVHHWYGTTWLNSGIFMNGQLIDGAIEAAPLSTALLTFRTQAPRGINTLGTDRFIDNQYWHGWFSELIFFDRLLGSVEEAKIQRYLMEKWGLPTRYFHAPFTLPNENGLLLLSGPEGARLDAVALKRTLRDVSLQRVVDRKEFGFVTHPSPGSPPQDNGYMGILEPVHASIAAGVYDQPVSVELGHEDGAVQIRYTLNGDEPGEDSILYSTPISIARSSVLKAKAFRQDYLSGETMTASYLIEFPTTIPVVSISGPPDDWFSAERGIYTLGERAATERPHFGANFWQAWEREVEFEWFEPSGERTHQQRAGAKIHGGWSRASDQKSVVLIARSRYGNNRFDGRFFDSNEKVSVKQLLLRNGGNDWTLAMLRDPLGQSLMGDIGLDTQPYRPVHVFLNGEYYGMHNLRQRANEHFLSAETGIPDDQMDVVASNFDALAGDHAGALAFIRWIALQDASDPKFEEELERQMDVDNFLDYMIGEICIDNFDWPNNNVRFWKERQPDARWRWMPFDVDGAFNPLGWNIRVNTIRRIINYKVHSAAKVFVAVTENEALRRRFILRFQHRLNNTFSTHNMLSRLESMASAIRPEMPRHIERWKGSKVGDLSFPNTINEWEERLDVIREFARERPDAIRGFVASEFGLEEPVSIRLNVPSSDTGEIRIDGLPLVHPQDGPWEGQFFTEYDITVSAQPKNGFAFRGWAELNTTSPEITVSPSRIRSLTPVFEQIAEPMPAGTEGRILISEIMYHPATHRPNEEFIELVNVDDHPVQLHGWSVDRGISFEFPDVTLEPGGYVVVAADPVAYQTAYPDAPTPLGPWSGKLKNSGEQIRLRNHLNQTVDALDFKDEGDWSERVRGVPMGGHQGWMWSNAHDGDGYSLERISMNADGKQGQNWGASKQLGGTPGEVNSIHQSILAPFILQVKHTP
ncbi:MAG: CotH kinase family protein, partial [Verrucomicrobia bacterium]|nr:CotH kinase family protein [Verrucomicrobiota bacterium]